MKWMIRAGKRKLINLQQQPEQIEMSWTMKIQQSERVHCPMIKGAAMTTTLERISDEGAISLVENYKLYNH